jgi:uncharacterized protein
VKPTYFDLTVRDVAKAKAFFEAVLGWRFERFPMPYEYHSIKAGPAEEPGIDGGIGALADAPIARGQPMTLLTMQVPDLDEALARVQAHGGSVVEPRTAIAGVGWYATCAEPGGLRFGVIEEDAAASPTMRGPDESSREGAA